MGFFFSGKATSKKLSKLPDTLIRESGCKVCPTKTNNKLHNMLSTGDAEPIIYVLGEHPTKNDVEDSVHFSDAAGTLLRTILRKQFPDFFPSNNIFKSVNIRYNNILRCIPKDTIPSQLELDCCRKQVEDDIEQSKPLIVIGLCNLDGAYFLDKKEKKSMLINWMVDGRYCSHWRGRKIPMKMGNHPFWFFPIIHPAFVLRKRRKNNKTEFDNCFDKDIKNIADFLEEYKEPIIIENGYRENIKVFLGKDKSEIEEIRKELAILVNEPEIAIDTETHNLHPWTLSDLTDKHPLMKLPSRILSIAIGTDKHTISFPIDHPLAWDDSYRQDIRDLLKDFLLNSGTKICHNLKFELTWFNHYFGQDVLRKTQWADTMSQAYIIDERTSLEEGMLALDRLCYIHFGFNLKVLSNVDRKACIKAPLDRLLLYNGMDTKYTFKLYQLQKLLIAKKQEWVVNHQNRGAVTLALAETKGLCTDENLYKRLLIEYTGDENYVLNKDELVKGGKIGKSVELIQNQDCIKEYEKLYGEFNPNSGKHLAKLFGKVLKLTAITSTDSGAFSTDEDSLQEFAKKHPIAKYILEYKKFSKLLSTYITPVPGLINNVDKKIHADFKSMFTGTGRFSCENPNLQNWPSRNNKWVRQLVIPPENHMIVAVDYAQLEARIVGTVSQDKVFCDEIWNDYDIHLGWATRICKRYPQIVGKAKFEDITKDELKAFRKVVKGAWVFQIIYGGSKYSVAQQVGLPMEIMDIMYDEFWDTLKEVKKWQEDITKFYFANEYVETPTGRRRHGPMHINKFTNSPIQGGSSDIVVNAMNNLSELAYSLNKPQYQAVINIHDDLTFYIPEDSLEEDIDFIAKQMTKVEFDWITVPLGVEVSVGKNWGELEEVAKFKTTDFWDFKRK